MTISDPDEAANQSPNVTLHPIRGIVWAAFWGTPLAAGIVLAINYSRLGRSSAARNSVIVGSLATIVLFALIFFIPESLLDRIPNAAFIVPQLFAVHAVAKSLQAATIESHEAAGGRVATAWPSVGIGLLCLPLIMIPLYLYIASQEAALGTKVAFGQDEIYYSGDCTEADAVGLAQTLREVEFFGQGGATALLRRSSEGTTVSFILVDGAWKDPEIVEAFYDLGEVMIEANEWNSVIIEFCDEYFSVKKTILLPRDAAVEQSTQAHPGLPETQAQRPTNTDAHAA